MFKMSVDRCSGNQGPEAAKGKTRILNGEGKWA